MIVRILSQGQYDVPDERLAELNEADDRIVQAIDAGDDAGFVAALRQLLDAVLAAGSPVPVDALVSSDLVLPAPDATLAEVRDLLGDEGLVPD